MKNIQRKQQLRSQSINSFKAGLDSLPILSAKAYQAQKVDTILTVYKSIKY